MARGTERSQGSERATVGRKQDKASEGWWRQNGGERAYVSIWCWQRHHGVSQGPQWTQTLDVCVCVHSTHVSNGWHTVCNTCTAFKKRKRKSVLNTWDLIELWFAVCASLFLTVCFLHYKIFLSGVWLWATVLIWGPFECLDLTAGGVTAFVQTHMQTYTQTQA